MLAPSVFVPLGLGLAVVGVLAWVLYLVGSRMEQLQRIRDQKAQELEAESMRRRHETRLPGARPDHPIEVASAAVIEPRATSLPCPRCTGPAHVDEHGVEHHQSRRLRVTRMRCGSCGYQRAIYFALRQSPPG